VNEEVVCGPQSLTLRPEHCHLRPISGAAAQEIRSGSWFQQWQDQEILHRQPRQKLCARKLVKKPAFALAVNSFRPNATETNTKRRAHFGQPSAGSWGHRDDGGVQCVTRRQADQAGYVMIQQQLCKFISVY
jgi:hypothetical protein